MAKTKLVLFDIDGTLLLSGGAGEKALRLALKERFGKDDDLAQIEIAGRTDSGIAREIFQWHGIDATPENLNAFLESYLHHLEQLLPRTPGRLMPGIVELLETLHARPHLALGLLTGNISAGARLKLTHYGVAHFFEFGAFADDSHDRSQLGPFARTRAREKHGVEFADADIFVLGDTPHDIDCGRAFGAKTVAIATGNFSREQLLAHAPDFLFEDLSDVPGVIARLGL